MTIKISPNSFFKKQRIPTDGAVKLMAMFKDFPATETSTLTLNGESLANRMVVSGSVASPPAYGYGELKGGYLSFYVDNTDLSESAKMPSLNLFKLQDEMSIKEGGFTLYDNTEKMEVYSSYIDNSQPYIEESFDGSEKALGEVEIVHGGGGGSLITLENPYLLANEADALLWVGGTQSMFHPGNDESDERVLAKYFGTAQGGVTREVPIKPRKKKKLSGLWINKNDWREDYEKFTIFRPFWKWNDIKPIVRFGGRRTNPASSEAAKTPTSNNTIFDIIRRTPDNNTAYDNSDEATSPWAFTTLELSSDKFDVGGQSLHCHHMWTYTAGTVASSGLFGVSGQASTQFACLSTSHLPYPMPMDVSRTSALSTLSGATANKSENISRGEVNIKFNISKMDTYLNFCSTTPAGGEVTAKIKCFNYWKHSQTGNTDEANFMEDMNSSVCLAPTFLRAFVVTFSNYKPNPGENFDEFMNRGMGEFYISGNSHIVGGFGVVRKVGSSTASDTGESQESKKASIIPIHTRPSHYWTDKWRQESTGTGPLPMFAISGTQVQNPNTTKKNPCKVFFGGMYSINSASGTNAAALANTNDRYEPTIDMPLDEWVNVKVVFDVTEPNLCYFEAPDSGSAGEDSNIRMCKAYLTEGYESSVTSGPSVVELDDPPSIPIYFPIKRGTSGNPHQNQWNWQDNPERWPNNMTVWINNYRFITRQEANWVNPVTGSDSGNFQGQQRLDGEYPRATGSMAEGANGKPWDGTGQATPADGAAREVEVWIDSITFNNFGLETMNNSASASVFSTPIPLKNHPMKSMVSGTADRMASSNTAGQPIYNMYTPTYLSIGFDNVHNASGALSTGSSGDLPAANWSDSGSASPIYTVQEVYKYGYLFWNGFSTAKFSQLEKQNSYCTHAWKSMTSGSMSNAAASAAYENAYANYFGGTCLAGGVSGTATQKSPVYGSFLMYNDGAPVTDGSNVFTATSGSNSYMSTDGMTQKGFTYLNVQTNSAADGVQFVDSTLRATNGSKTVTHTTNSGAPKVGMSVFIHTLPIFDAPNNHITKINSATSFDLNTAAGSDWTNATGSFYDVNEVWDKRENIHASSRIIGMPTFDMGDELAAYGDNSVVVDNPSIFRDNTDSNTKYVIYRVTTSGTTAQVTGTGVVTTTIPDLSGATQTIVCRSPHLTVKEKRGDVIVFNEPVKGPAYDTGDGKNIVNSYNLPFLFVSPVKYWVTYQIYPGETIGSTSHPNQGAFISGTQGADKSYDTLCFLSGTTAPTTAGTGSTWNEFDYFYETTLTGTTGRSGIYGRPWFLERGEDTNLDIEQDMGHGAWDDEKDEGGEAAKSVAYTNTFIDLDISKAVQATAMQPDQTVLFTLGMDNPTANQSITFTGNDFAGATYLQKNPAFNWEFIDPVPIVNQLRVSPMFDALSSEANLYELENEDLNAVVFTWNEETDDDVWYRMLFVHSGSIYNKYERAKCWAPLNEAPGGGGAQGNNFLPGIKYHTVYNMLDTTSFSAGTGPKAVQTLEGLQGWAANQELGASWIDIPHASNSMMTGLTEYTLAFHLKPVSGSGIVFNKGKSTDTTKSELEMSSGQFIYTHGETPLSSVSTSPVDGDTPTSVIITYRSGSSDHQPLKLFINGSKEDFHYEATKGTLGPITTTSGAVLGSRALGANAWAGIQEEVVLWDKCWYIPEQANQYILNTADLTEFVSEKAITQNAKLFVMDYHNIRGKSTGKVGSSNTASWKVTL